LIGISTVVLRIYSILPGAERKRSRRQGVDMSKNCSIAIFLGSGGHTSEALALVSALDFSRYTPRVYIISEGDSLSAEKAVALEARKTSSNKNEHAKREYTLLAIPRARRIHQSLITTVPTAIISFFNCVDHVTMQPLLSPGDPRPFADVLILNGPGTCFVLCAAVYVNKFFWTAIVQTDLCRILCARSITQSLRKAPSATRGQIYRTMATAAKTRGKGRISWMAGLDAEVESRICKALVRVADSKGRTSRTPHIGLVALIVHVRFSVS